MTCQPTTRPLRIPRTALRSAVSLLALAAAWTATAPPARAQTPNAPTAATQQSPAFNHPGVARDADRYEAQLKAALKLAGAPTDVKTADLLAQGNRLMPTNPRAALPPFSQAAILAPDNAEAWTALARALLATTPLPNVASERYQLPLNASAAAYLAYTRATTTARRAEALVVLADALKRRSYWRPAIDALATSLKLAENPDARRAYDTLRAEHGFRVTDHRLDTDAASPRLCVQFSEALSRANVDFAKFVSVDGKDPQSITTDTRQLCVEGLKHGQRYEVKVRAGLPSDIGEALQKTAEITAYVRDRSPVVRFSGRNYVLPSRGQNGIPLVAVNTDRAEIEIYRVGDRSLAQTVQSGDFQKQLTSYDVERLRERNGAVVWKGAIETPMTLNKETTAAVPVGEAIGTLQPGAYAMIARPAANARAANDDAWATQWFVVSDLGLTALTGDDGVTAIVRALSSADAVSNATVRLLARNNEILATAKPDANGLVRFAASLARGEGGLAPQLLVAESTAGDYAFLDLTQSAFDLADRGVKGRPAPGPIDGYLFAERGIYRPGDDVHLTALVRDAAGRAAGLPVTLIVTRPDGVEHRRLALADQGLGGRLTTLGLSGSAMTGTWRAAVHVDPKTPAIAQTAFLVEDFVPERLSLELTTDGKPITPDAPATIKLAGRYLYGPPAANLAVEGEIVVKPSTRDVTGFPGYLFGSADERIAPVRKPLDALPSTAADGTASLQIALPQVTKTARPLSADVIVRLREPGGRTIERTTSLPVDLKLPRIGIKPAFGSQGPIEGQPATFDVVRVGADGRQATGPLDWTLYRLDTSWQWFKRDGQWAYEAVSLTRKIASGKAEAATDKPARIEARVDWGRFRLDVTAPGDVATASSLAFSSGWNTSGDDADSPETLDVALDKPSYKAGETAKLRIASRLAGKAVVAVLGGGVRTVLTADVAKGGGEIAVPVGNDWGPGAYVTAVLYRPMDIAAKRMPARAIGVAWLALDPAARTLAVKLDTPQKVKSASKLTVPIALEGLTAGEDARVTLAAVDVGILNVTRYTAPKPEGWFNAQTRLGVEIRDLYGRLIDGMRAERGKLRSGGDGAGGMTADGSPPVETLLALHSGIVKVGPDGRAKVDFDLPDFNGTVRLMAVAWSASKTGSASTDVVVRDAVALTASTPRFMTLGDDVRIALDLHNVEGTPADYTLAVSGGSVADVGAEPPATEVARRTVALKAAERRQETLTLKPVTIGPAIYRVRVTGPGGIDVRRELTFDVKVPAGDIRRTTVSRIEPGRSLTLSADVTADLIPARTSINLSVGPFASLDVPGLLTALDRYPYGCAEQTVSRALPLLYANAVATTIGLAKDRSIKERVQKAVDRVFEMQDSAGAFGVWGPHNSDMWLTAYVTDFLSRAKEQGYVVPPRAFTQALDKLQAYVSYAQDFARGGEARAYAMYVLARNARAPVGELRYFADTRLDRFATPLAQAQLGAALAMMGDKVRAETVFAKAMSGLDGDDDQSRTDYGSRLRDGAALVTLASETGIARPQAVALVDVVAKAYRARTHTSTQEQAWMLLAANALADQAKATSLTVAGTRVLGPHVRTISADALKRGAITIRNDGDAPVDAVVSVSGAALTPEPALANGFTLERKAFTLDGKPVDLASLVGGTATLKQNDRLVMVLKVEAKETGGRVLLVDRLPAGLEIENPRLVDGGDIKSLPWLKSTVKPQHTGFRDDRFVAAFDFFGRRDNDDGDAKDAASQATVAYIVRAVTPGRYVHPAATVEDMYRPERHARSAAGTLTIEAAGK